MQDRSTPVIPSFVVHADDVVETDGRYPAPFDAEVLSSGRDLGRAARTVRVGVWRERLPPGRRTSRTHAHSHEEELVYVLEGECHVRIAPPGTASYELLLRAGHVVSFPAGTGIAHSFVNRSDAECLLLAIGERRPLEDRAWYPEDPDLEAWRSENRPTRTWAGPPALPTYLRRATAADVTALLDRMERFNAGEGIGWDRARTERALGVLITDAAIGFVLVYAPDPAAEFDGYVVVTYGFDLEWGGRDAFVTELFVDEDARGRGVAKALVDAAALLARDAGAQALHLVVRPENVAAGELYRARGFARVPRELYTKVLTP